jgi:hypothetical protein
MPERILVLGITDQGGTLGYVVSPRSSLNGEIRKLSGLSEVGVFTEIPLTSTGDSRDILIAELKRIHTKGWISGCMLKDNEVVEYNSPNAGGYTLECELGVRPSGEAAPDFLGWEVKSHRVGDFEDFGSESITLMTPEPTGGHYAEQSVESFTRRFGYVALDGTPDRLNFGGIHRVGEFHHRTGLRLEFRGYDSARGITDDHGGIYLTAAGGEIAASWSFAPLLKHWNRKHARAVYVPRMSRKDNSRREFWFGPIVRLGENTDFILFLRALEDGTIYYDPALKVVNASSDHPRVKRRNQFRVKSQDISRLYHLMSEVDVRQSRRQTPG